MNIAVIVGASGMMGRHFIQAIQTHGRDNFQNIVAISRTFRDAEADAPSKAESTVSNTPAPIPVTHVSIDLLSESDDSILQRVCSALQSLAVKASDSAPPSLICEVSVFYCFGLETAVKDESEDNADKRKMQRSQVDVLKLFLGLRNSDASHSLKRAFRVCKYIVLGSYLTHIMRTIHDFDLNLEYARIRWKQLSLACDFMNSDSSLQLFYFEMPFMLSRTGFASYFHALSKNSDSPFPVSPRATVSVVCADAFTEFVVSRLRTSSESDAVMKRGVYLLVGNDYKLSDVVALICFKYLQRQIVCPIDVPHQWIYALALKFAGKTRMERQEAAAWIPILGKYSDLRHQIQEKEVQFLSEVSDSTRSAGSFVMPLNGIHALVINEKVSDLEEAVRKRARTFHSIRSVVFGILSLLAACIIALL